MHPTKTIFLAFTDNKSATGDYYRALAKELASRGYSVNILTPGRRTHKVSPETNPAIYTWPSYRPTKLRDAWFLFKLIRQFRPALIMANFGAVNITMLVSWLSGVLIRLATYRTSAHFDFLKKRNIFKQTLFKYRKIIPYRLATNVLPVAKVLSEELHQIYKVPHEKIQYFHNAIQNPKIFISNTHKQSMALICVGGLTKGKGQEILLKSLASVRETLPVVHLYLAGTGDRQDHLVHMVREYGIQKHVTFLGKLPHQIVLEKIAIAKILILPTRYDACPKVIIEAMSVGTPVIASNVGGIPELIRNGIEGFLIPPQNPEVLADTILHMLNHPNLIKRMGQNAYDRFIDKFELKKAIEHQADWMENEIANIG